MACPVMVMIHTLRQHADGLAKVARLAVGPVCILEHACHEAQLAQKAVLARTVRRDMRLRQTPDRERIMHHLYQWVRVRIEDVRLQTAEGRAVVEPADVSIRYVLVEILHHTHPKSKSSTPNFEYSISTLR